MNKNSVNNRESQDSQDDTALDNLLRSAKVDLPLPNAFQSEVWRRIAGREQSTFAARMNSRINVFMGALARPAAAGFAILGMISAGLWFGSRGVPSARDAKFVYIESVSPFAREYQVAKSR